MSTWAYPNIKYQNKKAIDQMLTKVNILSDTVKLGTRYAMMTDSREDINDIIKNICRQKEIESIRIINKQGQIKFSNSPSEIDLKSDVESQACYVCHRGREESPLDSASLLERTRIYDSSNGHRVLALITPIYNEPGCSTHACHIHPQNKKVLGVLDVVASLESADREILSYQHRIVALGILVFTGISVGIGVFLTVFLNRPIKRIIKGIRLISQGEYNHQIDLNRRDEIGQLATAINKMGKQIGEKQEELNKQRDEFQNLFEHVPCYITVQDRDLKLIRYNREFATHFDAKIGDYCYRAYKNRSERCEICPVMMTFEDGAPHSSEETGINKDGTRSYWTVRTSPIRNSQGEIVAAMEMSLDITRSKRLEEEVKKSEEKYQVIFNNIPDPLFVLDKENLEILDCNDSITSVYGFHKHELLKTSFLNLFDKDEEVDYFSQLKTSNTLNRARQITKEGRTIFVNIRVSPSEYLGQDVLLVTTSDITERLTAEQQLIQAGKMATLGEMATGIAHELNQPLSVIKTASSYLMRKINRKERIEDEILKTLAEEMDSYVDRASNIINHMREFGRKSEVKKEKVHVNDVLNKALDIFGQQLKLREIEIVREYEENLPPILADANRLEQVFINLLINARDAIEERWNQADHRKGMKKISLKTSSQEGMVTIEFRDTGTGIPKSIIDKIFEPFFTTKKVGKGTGLGLSISYSIVRDYDGVIKVKSRENEGSNFIVQFPIAE
nr:PAS domain S-box protein [Desulfobacterales bacterium]